MAEQDVLIEMYYDSAWHDITDQAYIRDEIVMLRGDGDEGAAPRPASTSLTLDNRSQEFNPRFAQSPLWGKVARYTPLRVTVDGLVRNVTQINSFENKRTTDYDRLAQTGDCEMNIESGGVLYQIAQSGEPPRSAQFRQGIQYATSVGYWPGEDGRTATALSTAYASGDPALFTQARLASPGTGTIEAFAATDGPVGSDRLFQISEDPSSVALGLVSIFGYFAGVGGGTTGYQFGWECKFPSIPTPGNINGIIYLNDTEGRQYFIGISNTGYEISVSDASGFSDTFDFGSGGVTPLDWVMFNFVVSRSGGTATWELTWWDTEGEGNTISDTFPATSLGQLQWWAILADDNNAGAYYGHLIGLSSPATEDLNSSERIAAWTGNVDELLTSRFGRLMNEAGYFWDVDGTSTTSMGIQPVATIAEHLRQIRDTEDGLIFDMQDDTGIVLRTRATRLGQASVLDLHYSDLAPSLPEVIDVLDISNDITIKQDGGGEYNTKLETGPLAVSNFDAPLTIGVNFAEEAASLAPFGEWWLNRGTVDGTRYPTLTIDLVATPWLAASVAAVEPGDRITLADVEPDLADLFVIGIKDVVGSHTRKVSFICKPNTIFNSGVYNDMVRRYDVDSLTKAVIDKTAVSWAIEGVSEHNVWSTTSLPYDWMVEGERVRVTGMTAPVLVSPTSYTQTATVQRSINGIVKTHAIGESIHMHPEQLARYGF